MTAVDIVDMSSGVTSLFTVKFNQCGKCGRNNKCVTRYFGTGLACTWQGPCSTTHHIGQLWLQNICKVQGQKAAAAACGTPLPQLVTAELSRQSSVNS